MKTFSIRLTSLAAALCAAGFAQSVSAADITFFGFLDQGVTYRHEDLNYGMRGPQGQSSWAPSPIGEDGTVAAAGSKSTVEQGTGNVSTWGIKGSEEIGEGTKVIFHLESGFLADDGTIYGSGNKIFERESSVGIESPTYGQIKFGRFPALTTGSGTTGIFNSRVNPFGAGWGNMTGGWKFAGTLANARYDNMINYISPKFGGLRLHAQYSFKNSGDDAAEEGSSKTDRWWAVGATYTAERFYLAAAVDCIDYANRQDYYVNGTVRSAEDAYKVLVGGHYDFGTFKLYGTAQYMKNVPWIGGYSTKEVAPMLADDFKSGVDFGCDENREHLAMLAHTGFYREGEYVDQLLTFHQLDFSNAHAVTEKFSFEGRPESNEFMGDLDQLFHDPNSIVSSSDIIDVIENGPIEGVSNGGAPCREHTRLSDKAETVKSACSKIAETEQREPGIEQPTQIEAK